MELCQLSQCILVQWLPLCCRTDKDSLHHRHYIAYYIHITYTDMCIHVLQINSFCMTDNIKQKILQILQNVLCGACMFMWCASLFKQQAAEDTTDYGLTMRVSFLNAPHAGNKGNT